MFKLVPQQGDVDVARGDVDVAEEQVPVLRYGEEQIAMVGPGGEVQIEAGGVHAAGEVEPIVRPIPLPLPVPPTLVFAPPPIAPPTTAEMLAR